MYNDKLVLSDVGMHAINNASAGGLLVDATRFKLGNSRLDKDRTDIVDLLGEVLLQGTIHHVETVNRNITRFTFEVPSHTVTEDTFVMEGAVYLSTGVLLGRVVFSEPVMLYKGETARFVCLLTTERCDLTTINVTIGDFSGMPSTPFIHQLQSPSLSNVNAVTVLNGMKNQDGSLSPVIAMRYSAGSYQWAFTDHTCVYRGEPSTATETQVTIPGIELEENEVAILHIVAGSGVGQTRRVKFSGNKLVEVDSKPITGLTKNTTVALWKRIFTPSTGSGMGACTWPPRLDNIPGDWVITRGKGDCPVWAPVRQQNKSGGLLWSPPSKLRIDLLNFTGSGDNARYPLNTLELEDVNYLQPYLGGATQHRSAFDMTGNELEFTENLPVGLPVELRMYSREPSNGSRLLIKVDNFTGDGVNQNFKVSQAVENSNYAKVYIRGVYQFATTFTYDAATQTIKMVSPVAAGMSVEIRTYRFVEDEGYSTKVKTHTFTTRDETYFVELPFVPQSSEFIEVSLSGAYVHTSQYSLVGNKIIMSGPIRRGLEVEVTLYDNQMSLGSSTGDLPGVVVDAVLSGYSLKLMRHNAPPISLPIPGVSLTSGPGIKITGKHPFYSIESTINNQLVDASANFVVSDFRVLDDASEIMFTSRVNLTIDMMLTVHSDFSAILGPGFMTTEGLEIMEYVVGFRTSKSTEVDYGRGLKGTGVAGFSSLQGKNDTAYANSSMTQVYEVIAENHKSGYIDVVIKMRVKNANIGNYSSRLTINSNIVGSAKVT